jgi:hypothetical protein
VLAGCPLALRRDHSVRHITSDHAGYHGRARQRETQFHHGQLGKKPSGEHQVAYFLEHIEPIPTGVALITGDLLHNLRAALDHTVYQLACVQIGEPKDPYKWAAFPVGETEDHYKEIRNKSLGRKNVGRLSDATIAAIDGLKPYKGGNTALWQLGALDNVDKHRLVLTPASALTNANVGQSTPEAILGLRTWPAEPVCPLQLGQVLITCPPSPGIVVEVSFDIGIHEPGIVTDGSLMKTLFGFVDRVSEAIEVLGPFLE